MLTPAANATVRTKWRFAAIDIQGNPYNVDPFNRGFLFLIKKLQKLL